MPSSTPTSAAIPQVRHGHGRLHFVMLLVTVCWSCNIIAGKEALRGFTPLALAQLRVAATAVVYAACFLVMGDWGRLRLPRRKWLVLALTGLAGVALNQICFIGGLSRSSVAHSGLIVALGPIMVLVIAVLLRLEPLTVIKFLGMLISFGGVGLLTADRAGRGNIGNWMGDVILLMGTALFAVYTVLMKEIAADYDTLTLNTLVFGLGAIQMTPFCLHAVRATHWAALPWDAWWGLGFMVICGSIVPYLLFALAIKELAASRVAAFNYLQPVMASSLAIWLLSEHMTKKVVIGGVLILAGVYLAERERGEDPSPDGAPSAAEA